MNKAQQITLVGALALLLAAFLPWISVTALYGNVPGVDEGIAIGWEGDGILTGGIGLILLIGALLSKGKPGKRFLIPGVILGLLACAIVVSDFLTITEIGPDAGMFAATDVGLYLTLAGAIIAVIGGLQTTPIVKNPLMS